MLKEILFKKGITDLLMFLIFSAFLFLSCSSTIQYRQKGWRLRESFDFNWKFFKGDFLGAEQVAFSDENWRKINLPHDWSIEGPFQKDNPTGARGGYLPAGIGWYRKHFKLPEQYKDKKVFIQFDGVYMNSDVWINSHHLGKRPYGYISFYYDLTPYIKFADQGNVLAVRVDNSRQPNSRWYSGSGIYRHVWLIISDKLHIGHWGTYVTTPEVSRESAIVEIKTRVKNEYEVSKECTLITSIANKDDRVINTIKSTYDIEGDSQYEFVHRIRIENPNLWSTHHPYLYRVYSVVKDGDRIVDSYETPLGIREFHFDSNRGFFLNGENIKIKGTCIHHDCGPLGAACPDRAIERKIEILKEMGCNAIRTSHNPPSPVLLDYCDQYGLLVMDEAFDEWKIGKKPAVFDQSGKKKRILIHGYHEYFDEWAIKDLKSMIHRDRNHPSIILWSVGNEVIEQRSPEGVEILKRLIKVVHEEDPTRPVTAGCNNISEANKTGFAELLDVVGYNYFGGGGQKNIRRYEIDHTNYPKRKMLGSEVASAISTRGIYKTENKYTSSYDKNFGDWLPWSSSAEEAWKATIERDYIAGEFVWTGFDYLGEPSPYFWPARSSYFGIVDLCGFSKDAFYFYQSQWTDKPMLHIFPHWNWQEKEDEIIPVWAYTNCDSVELFMNGKSLGVKNFKSIKDLHLSWDIHFNPGTLRAVGWKDGEVLCRRERRATGYPAKIVLSPDRDIIVADGRDLSYITVEVVDKDGNIVPIADNLVTFDIEGEGKIIGVGNGDQLSHEDFQSDQRKVFNGLCLVIVQSTHQCGEIQLMATSPDLSSSTITIKSVSIESKE